MRTDFPCPNASPRLLTVPPSRGLSGLRRRSPPTSQQEDTPPSKHNGMVYWHPHNASRKNAEKVALSVMDEHFFSGVVLLRQYRTRCGSLAQRPSSSPYGPLTIALARWAINRRRPSRRSRISRRLRPLSSVSLGATTSPQQSKTAETQQTNRRRLGNSSYDIGHCKSRLIESDTMTGVV
jgi:hypothetical protein